jgi:general secretion pathway protein F
VGNYVTLMQTYRYRAARRDGIIVSGLIEAPSGTDASATLVARGLHPLGLNPSEHSDERRRPASRRDLAIVFRSIAALVGAGVPLERAVASSAALARGPLRVCLEAGQASLRQGQTLSQALEAGRGIVPPVVTGMIRAGERSSQLGRSLEHVATHLEQEADLVGRVRQALAYPLLLATAGTASVLVIGTVVVPKFAELLDDLGQELPASTRILLVVSGVLVRYGYLVLILLAGLVWAFVKWTGGAQGRLWCHRMLLATPVVGPVRHALASARFSRSLGSMLAAGMPLLPALQASREAAGDQAVAERLSRVYERVAQGQPLTSALEAESALIRNAVQLVDVGESSGTLAIMASRAGDLAAQESDRGLRILVSLLEPALVVTFGGVVAFVAAALLQAVYSVRPGGV